MKILFIDAAYRNGSRTKILADYYLSKLKGDIDRINLGEFRVEPLDAARIKEYNEAVKSKNYESPMFDVAKQFASADEIVIAAPFWNYGLPAALASYFELVCTQGITFDMGDKGKYFSKCNAKHLTFITTSGGYIPEENHAFNYIEDLTEVFFDIENVSYYRAEGLDIIGTDVEERLNQVMKLMDEEFEN